MEAVLKEARHLLLTSAVGIFASAAHAHEPASWSDRPSGLGSPHQNNETALFIECPDYGTTGHDECVQNAEALLNDTDDVALAKEQCRQMIWESERTATSVYLDCILNTSPQSRSKCESQEVEALKKPRAERAQCFRDAEADPHITRHVAEKLADQRFRISLGLLEPGLVWHYDATKRLIITQHRQATTRRKAEARNQRDSATERQSILNHFAAIQVQTDADVAARNRAVAARVQSALDAVRDEQRIEEVRQEFIDQVLGPCMVDFLATGGNDAAASTRLMPIAKSDPNVLLELARTMAPDVMAELDGAFREIADLFRSRNIDGSSEQAAQERRKYYRFFRGGLSDLCVTEEDD